MAAFDKQLIMDISMAIRHRLLRGDEIRKAFTPVDNEMVGETFKDYLTGNPLRDIPNLATEPAPLLSPKLRAYDRTGRLKPIIPDWERDRRIARLIAIEMERELHTLKLISERAKSKQHIKQQTT